MCQRRLRHSEPDELWTRLLPPDAFLGPTRHVRALNGSAAGFFGGASHAGPGCLFVLQRQASRMQWRFVPGIESNSSCLPPYHAGHSVVNGSCVACPVRTFLPPCAWASLSESTLGSSHWANRLHPPVWGGRSACLPRLTRLSQSDSAESIWRDSLTGPKFSTLRVLYSRNCHQNPSKRVPIILRGY
jgi:hypothetical protein